MAAASLIQPAEELCFDSAGKELLKWDWIRQELGAGAVADESEFAALNSKDLLDEAKSRKKLKLPLTDV